MNIELLAEIILAGLCIIVPLAVAFVWSLCRVAADTRSVDDGRAFGGDDE